MLHFNTSLFILLLLLGHHSSEILLGSSETSERSRIDFTEHQTILFGSGLNIETVDRQEYYCLDLKLHLYNPDNARTDFKVQVWSRSDTKTNQFELKWSKNIQNDHDGNFQIRYSEMIRISPHDSQLYIGLTNVKSFLPVPFDNENLEYEVESFAKKNSNNPQNQQEQIDRGSVHYFNKIEPRVYSINLRLKRNCEADKENTFVDAQSKECPMGYKLVDNSNHVCEDIDECTDLPNPPCEHFCHNKIGFYECSCRHGYQIDPANPKKCVDVDECSLFSPCGQNLRCVNEPGSFRCERDNGNTEIFDGYEFSCSNTTCPNSEQACLTTASGKDSVCVDVQKLSVDQLRYFDFMMHEIIFEIFKKREDYYKFLMITNMVWTGILSVALFLVAFGCVWKIKYTNDQI